MTLYAVRRIEDVTVADIAEEASMTSAAVYYHYPSKEDVLIEGLRSFAEGMTGELADQMEAVGERGGTLGEVVAAMVSWVEEHRASALVWFVSSPGVNESVEALRRETRLDMVEAFGSCIKSNGGANGGAARHGERHGDRRAVRAGVVVGADPGRGLRQPRAAPLRLRGDRARRPHRHGRRRRLSRRRQWDLLLPSGSLPLSTFGKPDGSTRSPNMCRLCV